MAKDNSEGTIVIPGKAPFGASVVWGQKGVGKTVTCLNSPWQPVHVVDTELSSAEYFVHQKRLIDMGVLRGEFTRADCLDYDSIYAEFCRISGVDPVKRKRVSDGEFYGTIVVDTGGQWSEWVAVLEQSAAKSDKLGQIVWGTIRSRLRNSILDLSKHCNCLLLTAHERKYNNVLSPRCNPALLEVSAMSIRLVRQPNRNVPDAEIKASRLPFFPPRIPAFEIEKLLGYFDNPADWENLSEGETIQEEPEYVAPTMDEDMED